MFTPHTESERDEMLRAIGVDRLEDLFRDVPEAVRFPKLNLPPAMTEMEILAEMQGIDPAVLHRVAAIAAGTLDSLPHNGAIVTLLAVLELIKRRQIEVTQDQPFGDIMITPVPGSEITEDETENGEE